MARLRAAPAWLWLAALVCVSAALRSWAALRIPIPWIAPDELIYAELGKTLYADGRLEILGAPTRFYGLVTPALAGLPLSLDDLEFGYRLLQIVQALVMSLAAIPVYLWGRTLTTRGWALGAAALTLAVPGLAYSGLIMTEVAFYPVLVLAVWAMAEALVRPTLARQAAVLGAILLACATRLQAAVLAPAFVTAVLVELLRQRRPSLAIRFWPAVVGLGLAGAAWAGWQLRHGGPASDLLGAYRAAGEVDYGLRDALRFVLYHAADVLVFTGVAPVCAVVALAAGRGLSPAQHAYLAVTASVTLWMTVAVGVFASRHVGHLAERNLFAVAPLFFLGAAVWLGLGAPRPRAATALAAAGAVALCVALPVDDLVSAATIPEGFTLIPVYRLEVRASGVDGDLVVAAAAAAAALALALLPRRLLPLLAAGLLVAFAAASVSASRVVAAQAHLNQPGTVGPNPRWVDTAADAQAAYLYTGDVYWNSVWETVFWNRRVRRVYDVLDAKVPGPIPQPSVGPLEDGRLVLKDGREVHTRFVVASDSLTFAGRPVANAGNSIVLWRAASPLRLTSWVQNVRFDGTIERRALVNVYACSGGALRLTLSAPARLTVELRRNGRPFRRRTLRPGEAWDTAIPALPPRPLGRRLCSFEIRVDAPVTVRRIGFVRSM